MQSVQGWTFWGSSLLALLVVFYLQQFFLTFEVALCHFRTLLSSYALLIYTSTPLVPKQKHKQITLCRF